MSMQTGSVDADGLARTTDGKLYVTLGSGGTISGQTFSTSSPNSNTLTLLGQSGAAVTAPADTNENALATIAVPANAMGANGRVRIRAIFTCTSSANNKTFKVVFGGTTILSHLVTTVSTDDVSIELMNLNATNSQRSSSGSVVTSSANTFTVQTTAAIDTTAAQNITITATKASAGESVVMVWYYVDLIR